MAVDAVQTPCTRMVLRTSDVLCMQCLLLQLQPDPNRNPRGTLAALSLFRKQSLATASVPGQ